MLQFDMLNLTILVAEDDEVTRENIVEYLQEHFSKVYEAKDGLEALKLYETYHPDIIISDIQMPKISGLELVEKIRLKDEKTPILITSAYSTTEYLLKAVELKLIKYLIKPVHPVELEQALKLCLESSHSHIQLKDNYVFDRFNKTLLKDEEPIKLRVKELLLLELLLKNLNRYVTYEEIEGYVWDDSVMSKDALKTLIKNIKSKLPEGSISNLSGQGYKLEC